MKAREGEDPKPVLSLTLALEKSKSHKKLEDKPF